MNKDVQVKVYTTNTCSHCRRAKDFLIQHNIEFIEVDALTDIGQTELEELGSHAVPTLVIGEQMIIGFKEERISKLLGL